MEDHYQIKTPFCDQISFNLARDQDFTAIVLQLLSIWLDKSVVIPIEVNELSVEDHFQLTENSANLTFGTKLRIMLQSQQKGSFFNQIALAK